MTKQAQPVDQHVGLKVRERRILRGVSQERLGELVGVSFQQIQKYEKGLNRIGASRLSQIAAVLEVPVSYFFDDSAPVRSQPGDGDAADAGTFLVTHESVELVRAFMAIPDRETRRRIIQLARSIADSAARATASAA